jgi:hypothetical protein
MSRVLVFGSQHGDIEVADAHGKAGMHAAHVRTCELALA